MSSNSQQQQSKGRGKGGKERKEVSFGSITIYEHSMILGDHPSANSSGPPIQLSWKLQDKYEHYNFDLYEYMRSMELDRKQYDDYFFDDHDQQQQPDQDPPQLQQRSSNCRILSGKRRKEILLSAGYKQDELDHVIKQMKYVKGQRAETRQEVKDEIEEEREANNKESRRFNKFLSAISIKRHIIDPIQKSIATARSA